MISSGKIMYLTGLVLRSSLDENEQTELLEQIRDYPPSKVSDLVEFLEMNQLDITQLGNYNNKDIDKRLNWLIENKKY